LKEQQLDGEVDAYTCGPPPMVDAVLPVLKRLGVALDRTHVDKFTPASASKPNLVH
jgi:propane monooxygenase reductase subunit